MIILIKCSFCPCLSTRWYCPYNFSNSLTLESPSEISEFPSRTLSGCSHCPTIIKMPVHYLRASVFLVYFSMSSSCCSHLNFQSVINLNSFNKCKAEDRHGTMDHMTSRSCRMDGACVLPPTCLTMVNKRST